MRSSVKKKSTLKSQLGFTGHLAVPEAGKGPGVLVLHAWWGLNGFFRGFCDRLAQEGFVVAAPDLYHGTTATTIEEAKKLRSKAKRPVLTKQVNTALETLRENPSRKGAKMGIIGFSMGAYWGLWLAEEEPKDIGAVVFFYGTRNGNYEKSQATFLGNFAENDEYCSARSVRELEKSLRSAGKDIDVHTYPGTEHWFFEEDRRDAYDPGAAKDAWKRTLNFLHATLSSG